MHNKTWTVHTVQFQMNFDIKSCTFQSFHDTALYLESLPYRLAYNSPLWASTFSALFSQCTAACGMQLVTVHSRAKVIVTWRSNKLSPSWWKTLRQKKGKKKKEKSMQRKSSFFSRKYTIALNVVDFSKTLRQNYGNSHRHFPTSSSWPCSKTCADEKFPLYQVFRTLSPRRVGLKFDSL